jgi:FAD/FMN-containing dehydrogenase
MSRRIAPTGAVVTPAPRLRGILPGHTEEVAAVVRACAAAGTAIVPQGGNTGLCGGATPTGGEVVVVLTRLNRIRDVDA